MKTKLLQRPSRQKQNGPDKSDRGTDRSDERHDHDQPMRGRGSFSTAGSEAKERGYAPQMLAGGKGTL
jgi:hypothetical protein